MTRSCMGTGPAVQGRSRPVVHEGPQQLPDGQSRVPLMSHVHSCPVAQGRLEESLTE